MPIRAYAKAINELLATLGKGARKPTASQADFHVQKIVALGTAADARYLLLARKPEADLLPDELKEMKLYQATHRKIIPLTIRAAISGAFRKTSSKR